MSVKSKVSDARKVAKKSGTYKDMKKIIEIGKEPKYDGSPESPEYRKFILQYYNWANLMFEPSDLKSHFIEYCKGAGYDYDELSSIPAYYFNKLGKLAYLYNNDAPISTDIDKSFDDAILQFITTWHEYEIKTSKPVYVEDENKLDAKTKAMFKYMDLYNEIDKTINMESTDRKNKILKIITDNKPPLNVVKTLHEHYEADQETYNIDLSQKRLPKTYKEVSTKFKTFADDVMEILNTQLVVAKNVKSSTRKPRKKKAIPNSKLVAKMTYLKQDDSIGMVSINPESIIGAKTLIVFNTKTRKFGIFNSIDENGLSVKGTTITNFIEDKSTCKTLRKPKEQLSELISGNKRKTEKTFNEINAVETSLKGRINDSVLLLKVFK